jgi:hypothetical protein
MNVRLTEGEFGDVEEKFNLEAAGGIEPPYTALQTVALPLG